MSLEIIGYFSLAAFILVFVFLVLRSVWLWYWKIDVIVNKLEEINKSLKALVGPEKINEIKSKVAITYDKKGRWVCPKCGYLNDQYRLDCYGCKYIKES